jgi:hypothetical protein
VSIIVTELHGADPQFVADISEPTVKLAALKRLLVEDAVFAVPSRPWWICSHGISAVISGPTANWRRPDSEIADRRESWRRQVEETVAELEHAPASP